MGKQKGFAPILVVLIIAALAFGGFYYFGTQRPKTSPQIVKSTQVISTPATDETANWKTYTSTESKYTFKYPQDWNFPSGISHGCGSTISSPSSEKMSLTICELGDNTINSEADFLKKEQSVNLGTYALVSQMQIKVNNYTGIETESQGPTGKYAAPGVLNDQIDVTIYRPGFTFNTLSISFSMEDQSQFDQGKEIFDKILSTFKFTDQNQTIDTFNLIFRSGSQLNTFEGTYSRDMVVDPPVKIKMILSKDEKDKIYQKMQEIKFFDYPDKFSVTVPPGETISTVTPCPDYYLKVAIGSKVKELSWSDCMINKNEKADKLRELMKLIENTIESKAEYKALPTPRAGYL